MSYDKIGDISAARGDRDGALKAYQEGLETSKALAARDPNNAEWQRDLSVSYNKIGDISAARGDRDGALKAYQGRAGDSKGARRPRSRQRRMAADLASKHWRLANMSKGFPYQRQCFSVSSIRAFWRIMPKSHRLRRPRSGLVDLPWSHSEFCKLCPITGR